MARTEASPPEQLIGIVQAIMRQKLWYSYHDDGSYDWPASVEQITQSIRQQLVWRQPDLEKKIRALMEQAFTPESLTLVDGRPPQPFIRKIAELGKKHNVPVTVWTVGDVAWQHTKFVNTGTNRWIDSGHFRCTRNNKHEDLARALIDMRRGISPQTVSHVYVVDDKWSNLELAQAMQQGVTDQNIIIHDYHMKLADPQANPTACFAYLEREIQARAKAGEQSGIVSDFDGVILDSDATLLNRASRSIAKAYLQQIPH